MLKPRTEAVLDALGTPTRRAILARLQKAPCAVGEIAAGLPVSRPAVSKHLRILRRARLVKARSMGTRTIYSLDARGFERARSWLDEFWDTALARFRMVAENTQENE